MKYRLERVNEVIKRELSELVAREINFNSNVIVTINAVEIAADLRQGQVYVGVIGEESEKANVLALLEERRIELQRALGKRVVLKYTPHLYFKLDTSIERGIRVLDIIQDLDRQDKE
jgi:ribosome-binding factor A